MLNKKIAYFSMGIGLNNNFRTYAGGLEILAGDIAKAAFKINASMYFMTILWKNGYNTQRINEDGTIIDDVPVENNWINYVEDTGKKVKIKMFERDLVLKIWKYKYGNAFFLDADTEENYPNNRDLVALTRSLYGGIWHNRSHERICQEMILGLGGVKALRELGINVEGYHFNDGHPVFAACELLSEKMKQGLSFYDALNQIKKEIYFTTHTNVPAGNESHSLEDIVLCGANVNLSKDQLYQIGGAPFSMTVAAIRLSDKEHCNGVAKLHAERAHEMWKFVKPDLKIKSITNGVDKYTWQAKNIRDAFEEVKYNKNYMKLLEEHLVNKKRLIDFIKYKNGVSFDLNSPLIGFARRATEYKRWNLVFRDEGRLENLIRKYNYQFVFSGKSHKDDMQGKGYISSVYKLSKKYPNNITFIQGYEISIGQLMTSGADCWLNTPRRPLEACGTSGMKAAMNGVLNISTLDGWWPEAEKSGVNGWSIGNTEENNYNGIQDQRDFESLMWLLENDVINAYNDKNRWAYMMYESIKMSETQFDAERMVREYYSNMYNY